jgi:hypothetical protein
MLFDRADDTLRPVVREGLRCESADDEAVIYDPAHHRTHYLNHSAYSIWLMCDGHTPLGAITSFVAGMYDADVSAVQGDVRKAVCEMLANGLLDLPSDGKPGSVRELTLHRVDEGSF